MNGYMIALLYNVHCRRTVGVSSIVVGAALMKLFQSGYER